jgi:sugar diacid utilization regulator
MDVRDLVHDPSLGIRVIASAPGALDRPVTGAYITDLSDPSRFLTAGDVVLTSGLWSARDGGPATFVDALARQHVAALVIGLIEIGHVPDEVIALCRERGLTLATVADRVSFKTVAEAIDRAQPDAALGLVERGLKFNRRLSDAMAHGDGALGALRLFHADFAIDSWILNDVGDVVASVGTPPERTHVARVWNEMIRADGAGPFRVADLADRTTSVWPLGSSPTQLPAGYFACWTDHRTLSQDARIVIDALTAALRVELELTVRWRDAAQARVAELIGALADDSISHGEISARMRLEGLDPQLPTSVVVAEIQDHAIPAAAVLNMATRMLSVTSTRVIGCTRDDRAVLLVNGQDTASYQEAVVRATEGYLPMLAGRQLRMGMSDRVTALGQLSSALDLATQRLDAVRGSDPIVWSDSSSIDDHRSLLAALGDANRAAFALEVLRPLIEYDTRHGAEFLGTLRTFLESNGAWQEAAKQLRVHPNTLRYRIQRIEEVTGRDLSTIGDRVDLYLALVCLSPEPGSAEGEAGQTVRGRVG